MSLISPKVTSSTQLFRLVSGMEDFQVGFRYGGLSCWFQVWRTFMLVSGKEDFQVGFRFGGLSGWFQV